MARGGINEIDLEEKEEGESRVEDCQEVTMIEVRISVEMVMTAADVHSSNALSEHSKAFGKFL